MKKNNKIYITPDSWDINNDTHAFYGKNATFNVDERTSIIGGVYHYRMTRFEKFKCWLATHWPWLENKICHIQYKLRN